MRSTTVRNLGPRLGFSAVLVAASIALASCSLIPTLHSPAAKTATPTASATAGYVYQDGVFEDTAAGYSVTFPGQPEVEPLAINGTDRLANLAAYGDTDTLAYVSRGEVRDGPPNLRGELFGWLQSIKTSGGIGASSDALDGLSALRAEFTMDGGPEGETIVAAHGKTFYQLIVLGGTPEQRQAFFDSFNLTGS